MPKHSETRHSPYSPEQLHAMVLDVMRYPEFLPWCRAARILQKEPEYFVAELVISFKNFTERYTSKITIPLIENGLAINVDLVSGPFKHLSNHWQFEPAPERGTHIHFAVDFAFKSRILDGLIGALFSRATEKMTRAFLNRADVLYGAPTKIDNP